ncbi:MAG: AMP-binding protein, partial [Acidimicrobiales bacterium]
MSDNAVNRFLVEPAQLSPDAIAVIDASTGETTTRAELLQATRSVARLLLSRGVVPEQRIIMCCLDSKAFLAWFWGTMWIGAVPVPVSTMLTEKDYQFLIEDSRAVGLVISDALKESVGQAAENQPFLSWTQKDHDDPELNVDAEFGTPFPAVDDDIAFWLYTSGTTGFPKGAMHRHADLAFCTDMYAKAVL